MLLEAAGVEPGVSAASGGPGVRKALLIWEDGTGGMAGRGEGEKVNGAVAVILDFEEPGGSGRGNALAYGRINID